MNSFVVLNCTFDGTSGDPNPICQVVGTVNKKNVYALVFYRFLVAASTANQMQEALTAAMFNYYAGVYYYQITPPWPNLIPFPEFPSLETESRRPLPVPGGFAGSSASASG